MSVSPSDIPMMRIKGGSFLMGSDRHYPEEAPVRRADVGDYMIDITPVTNESFARFVRETGHVTLAEIPPDPTDYPGMPPERAIAGSLVFVPPPRPVALTQPIWWHFIFGANWRHPEGPNSNIDLRPTHPVVHIAPGDAQAYADWAGKALPTECEWEYAARGGLENAEFSWGDTREPDGRIMANTWQGNFPWNSTKPPEAFRTSPVGAFPANGYGLHDMIGNVWEWTSDWFSLNTAEPRSGCCAPRARTADETESRGGGGTLRRVMKGGSHLCSPDYCQRYRPAARYPQPIDSPTSHIGFRCVKRLLT
ncbi:formylglycine-generating enzyme family protein [Acetobacter indonesiensis]